jgi:hypothetical protein
MDEVQKPSNSEVLYTTARTIQIVLIVFYFTLYSLSFSSTTLRVDWNSNLSDLYLGEVGLNLYQGHGVWLRY